ncbi:hypothetical protein BD410DRAFT_817396 [Rickenella mellea]|uniref:UBC core domain-containing protein n=1 Tax=Rickenella mellea TaxID=50990 RepID=A0A4R5XDP9_9AGAM|nr:hypothetical protein BD410DRAFT_817396 [Rickenella mellea]
MEDDNESGYGSEPMEIIDDVDSIPIVVSSPTKAKLTGRKLFRADIEELKKDCKAGLEFNGMRVDSLRSGEGEGSVEFKLHRAGKLFVSLSLHVSDSSDYPKSHNFLAMTQESDIDPLIVGVVELIYTLPSQTLQVVIRCLVASISSSIESGCIKMVEYIDIDESGSSEEEDADDMETDYEAADGDDYYIGGPASVDSHNSDLQQRTLQKDFKEIVAAGYRPGMTPLGFAIVLSVSVPVLKLDIPPRALIAWDSRLLSSTYNLTLIISGMRSAYPPINPDGTLVDMQAKLQFKVGLSPRYKPSAEAVTQAIRTFALKAEIVEAPPVLPPVPMEPDDPYASEEDEDEKEGETVEEEPEDEGRFEAFSLSTSLEGLLDQSLMELIKLRIKFGITWGGAEHLLRELELSQKPAQEVYQSIADVLDQLDDEEKELERSKTIPPDPLFANGTTHLNLPFIAFSYLVRRISLCPKYCLVCHHRINAEFEALKPYVCNNHLCAYRYFALNLGPSIEYEVIHHPRTVDLHLSLTYVAAAENALEREQMPINLGLQVQNQGLAGFVDFDDLPLPQMCVALKSLLNSLPSVASMKSYLEQKILPGQSKPLLIEMDRSVSPAAWSVLRWCIASATAYLEELTEPEDMVVGIDPEWCQFRFSVGAPDAEARFKDAILQAQTDNENAKRFPSIYAFHGSPLKNWHSIIRQGLLVKGIAHGRAYGNGVYFAKDGTTSVGYTSRMSGGNCWSKSGLCPSALLAVAELVNRTDRYVCSNPYYVVADTHWIICRYLFVKTAEAIEPPAQDAPKLDVPYLTIDPKHQLVFSYYSRGSSNGVKVPDHSYKLTRLLKARKSEQRDEPYEGEDAKLLGIMREVIDLTEDDGENDEGQDTWMHNHEWVEECSSHVMPAPFESTPGATAAIQRELKAMLKEQELAGRFDRLGWYLPPQFIGDNLYQWIVELHSFEEDLPLTADLKKYNINSLVFEIRFPSEFPHSPPFFRIIKPRFLPFIQGGGGHITGGGSICMDLLTADGWLPSYSISAVLLQIKLAISNPEPKPARLIDQWNTPYRASEALEGYKRAANAHGWKLPKNLNKLVRTH